jgi:hypothetical protein
MSRAREITPTERTKRLPTAERRGSNLAIPSNDNIMTNTIQLIQMRSKALLGFVFMTACASFPPPTDSLANAIASVRGAEEVGAADIPEAELQLQLAREEITKARALMAEGENEAAHYQALKATNDAELAIQLVREKQAREAAEAAEKTIDSVEAEVTP